MGRSMLFFLMFVLLGCSESTLSEKDLPHLNGYWEISKVEFPNGGEKSYDINPTIDFIQLEGTKGFRKKLQPKFDGSYQTSNTVEVLEVVKGNEDFILHYKSGLSEREETLIQLDSLGFIVRNDEGVKYTYKRFEPISIPK